MAFPPKVGDGEHRQIEGRQVEGRQLEARQMEGHQVESQADATGKDEVVAKLQKASFQQIEDDTSIDNGSTILSMTKGSHDEVQKEDITLPRRTSMVMAHTTKPVIEIHSVSTSRQISGPDTIDSTIIPTASPQRTGLQTLPEEIQQCILDHLAGVLRPTSPSLSGKNPGMRNWNDALRHPRGRHLSHLALVSPIWRELVQERLYRHVKIKGTLVSIADCVEWFARVKHQRLQQYVRHVEFWLPVWADKDNHGSNIDVTGRMTFGQVNRPRGVITIVTASLDTDDLHPSRTQFRLSSERVTLDEIFRVMSLVFPAACVMSIEGGHGKQSQKAKRFRHGTPSPIDLPILPQVRTLVLKGSWSILREESDFRFIAKALPHLQEWHASYAEPRAQAYTLMYDVARNSIPPTLTHLNISLDSLFGKDTTEDPKIREQQLYSHLCLNLGSIFDQLESFTLRGRMCSSLITTALAKGGMNRLRCLDLVVRNVCPSRNHYVDSASIHNRWFIRAFEALVLAAVQGLDRCPRLAFVRIRYIDFDSAYPRLHPYFLLFENRCSGIWNEALLATLAKVRPEAQYPDLGISPTRSNSPNSLLSNPTRRPSSMHTADYAAFANMFQET